MSYSKTLIIGNLGRDPELKYTPSGDAVCDFSIAVKNRRKTKNGWEDYTVWFKVTAWRKLAENAAKYLKKGSQAYVEGRLGIDEWNNNKGEKQTTLTIDASEIQFLGGTRQEEETPQYSGGGKGAAALDTQPDDGLSGSQKTANADDDIPF